MAYIFRIIDSMVYVISWSKRRQSMAKFISLELIKEGRPLFHTDCTVTPVMSSRYSAKSGEEKVDALPMNPLSDQQRLAREWKPKSEKSGE